MDITVGLQKGGARKSTTAVCLAIGIHRRTGKKVALIDADPRSQTAMDWSGVAGEAWPAGISVFPWWDADSITKRIRDIRPDYPYIIRDTGGDQPIVFEKCLEDTDLLIAPTAPQGAEVRRIPATMVLAQQVAAVRNKGLQVMALLVMVERNDVDARTVRAELAEAGVPVADTEIPRGKRYSRAFGNYPADLGAYEQFTDEVLKLEAS